MTTAQRRIQTACNRLAMCPIIKLRHIHHGLFTCAFCNQPITGGESYRSSSSDLRAHDFCFKAVVKEYSGARKAIEKAEGAA